jgi:hypothetical protein
MSATFSNKPYRIKFDVYDSNKNLTFGTISNHVLTDATVSDIKTLMNPGTYTDIKSEFFSANGTASLTSTELVNPFLFITYQIYLI